MTETLFLSQIILAVVITILVLLQKSSSIGLGSYSGSNDSVFGSKGPASFLTKTTFLIGFVFLMNTIALGYFYNKQVNESLVDTHKSIIPQVEKKTETKSNIPEAPASK